MITAGSHQSQNSSLRKTLEAQKRAILDTPEADRRFDWDLVVRWIDRSVRTLADSK